MYAYADESGHTGSNLLDIAQPTYYAAAVMCLTDLDAKYKPTFDAYAKKYGFKYLHAADMGMHRLTGLLPTLTKWIKRDTIRFFIGNIDKKWFILCKLFDFLFDPIENRAALWHVYWVQQLRYMMLVKLSLLMEEDDLRDAWEAIHGADYETSKTLLISVINRLAERVALLPDERSRTIIAEVFTWAIKYPEELGLSFKKRKQLLGHYPNVAMFTPLMLSIQKQSEYWHSSVKRIVHDRQSQFQTAWREMHTLLSQASEKPFHLIGGPEFKMRAAPGSSFVIGDSVTSAGIQLADIVLWFTKRMFDEKEVTPEVKEFMARVARHTEPYEMSYEGTIDVLEREVTPIMSMPMSNDKLKRGREIVETFEKQRMQSMLELEKKKSDESKRKK